jgi:hypothetical protein
VRELLASVQAKLKPFLYHKWLARFIRRQFHLECDHFNGIREAVLLADFATAMILGSGFKATCESDATANLYVVLVLYKRDGETKCDYVRFWSSAATSAEFHHKAMHVVAAHLKESGKDPGLRRLRVWTDGHTSTYKGAPSYTLLLPLNLRTPCNDYSCGSGFPNFGRMAYWPLSKIAPSTEADSAASEPALSGYEDAEEIEIFHNFFVAYHASGIIILPGDY